MDGQAAGDFKIKANTVQIQAKLLTGTELGNMRNVQLIQSKYLLYLVSVNLQICCLVYLVI